MCGPYIHHDGSKMIDFVEYQLSLPTGEVIYVSEIDPERITDAPTVEWIVSSPPELDSCTRVKRTVLESAIRGNSAPIMKALGIQPNGALIRVNPSLCGDRKGCPLFNPRRCSADPKIRRNREKLMHCWRHSSESPEREVITACVQAWSAGRYVIIVD